MKKSVVLISILIIGIFLSGCAPKETVENVTQQTGKAYIGGSKGLELSFVSNAPPDEVYALEENQETNPNTFDISVRVANVGEEDVAAEDMIVKLTGIDPGSFDKVADDFKETIPVESLEKTRMSVGEVIPGTYDFVDFTNLAYKYEVAGEYPAVVRASACYKYKTYATSKICVLEDFFGRGGASTLCKANEAKSVENSGAPVHIEAVQEQVSGKDGISIAFTVKQAGDNNDNIFKVISKDSEDACDGKKTENVNKVGVKVMLGNEELADCSGVNDEGIASLSPSTNSAEIRCRKVWSAADSRIDSEVPLKIELSYDYSQYVDKEIKVKQIGT